jgi:phospholipid/cholesterol/gamma-HCH transport system substrate-binding protein
MSDTKRSGAGSRGRRIVTTLLFLGLVLGGCSILRDDGSDRVHATTTFEDVADLADGAPVFMADVRIGNVDSIRLDDHGTQATLELSFDRSAGVPAEVEARLRRTSPLGEKFVELRPLTDEQDPPLLEDGAVIEQATVVPDFEDVVASGTDVFAALGASELASLLDEGARGFGGQGAHIHTVLGNFSDLIGGYADNTGEIRTLIQSIDDLASATGPAAQSHARALSQLAVTTRILDDQSTQLLDLVDSLSELSRQGGDILREHFEHITHQIQGLRSVVRAVRNGQAGLENLLAYTRGHNIALDLGTTGEFSQVLNDFIFCGVPGGGEGPGVNDCHDGGNP